MATAAVAEAPSLLLGRGEQIGDFRVVELSEGPLSGRVSVAVALEHPTLGLRLNAVQQRKGEIAAVKTARRNAEVPIRRTLSEMAPHVLVVTCRKPTAKVAEERAAMAFQVTLVRALVALMPVGVLFSGSVVLFWRGKTVPAFLQLLGAGFLVVVVLTHVSEALHVFTSLRWGVEHSPGHYLDLWSAVLGLTLFPIGYLFHALNVKPG